jgi:hypothetical protein
MLVIAAAMLDERFFLFVIAKNEFLYVQVKNAVSGFAVVNVFRCVAICQLGCNTDVASIVC